MQPTNLARVAVSAALAFAIAGCGPPKGETGGSISTGTTTEAERKSVQVSNETLDESVDRAAQQLMVELGDIPELTSEPRAAGRQCTIVLGNIIVKGDGVSHEDIAIVRRNLRRQLAQSRTLRETVRIIESRAEMTAIRNKERPPAEEPKEDLLQSQAGAPKKKVVEWWDPTQTFYLDGELFGRKRGATYTYDIGWNLTRDSDGAIIWASTGVKEKRGG